MELYSKKEVTLAIYYWFMLADGHCTDNEKAMFDLICSKLDMEEEKFIRGDDNAPQVIQAIKSVLKHKNENDSEVGGFMGVAIGAVSILGGKETNFSKSEKMEIVWNLINLGYA